MEVQSYDGEILKITGQQKTLISTWARYQDNVCKYQLTVVTGGSNPLHYTEVRFSFDVHPKNSRKFGRTWILGNSVDWIYSRGHGSRVNAILFYEILEKRFDNQCDLEQLEYVD